MYSWYKYAAFLGFTLTRTVPDQYTLIEQSCRLCYSNKAVHTKYVQFLFTVYTGDQLSISGARLCLVDSWLVQN